MPESEKQGQQVSVKLSDIPRQNTLGVQSVYTNAANVFFTQWDARFIFNEIVMDADGKAVVEARASVVMSPAHAEAFMRVLETALAGWREGEQKAEKQPAGR